MKKRHLVSGAVFGCLLAAATAWGELVNEWQPIQTSLKGEKVPEPVLKGNVWIEPITGMEFIWIPGGCYKIGSAPRVEGRDSDEGPVHEACVSSFWLGKTEVTQSQWRLVMLNNPAKFQRGDDFPVERVAWDDVDNYIAKLTERHKDRFTFRLPTEIEWEYACTGGGSRVRYSGGADPDAAGWYRNNSRASTQPVGTAKPNPLGIYDLSGNVWEWVQDAYLNFSYNKNKMKELKIDPLSHQSIFRVIRGGGWNTLAPGVRCANRGFEGFTERRESIGFRLVRATKKKEKRIRELGEIPL